MDTDTFGYKFGQMVYTFALTTFAWIFFRAGSISEAFTYITNMFTKWNPWVIFDGSMFNLGLDATEVTVLVASVILLTIMDILRVTKGKTFGEMMLEQNPPFRIIVVLLLIVLIIVFGEYGIMFDSKKFIYFDF